VRKFGWVEERDKVCVRGRKNEREDEDIEIRLARIRKVK
jgi:hypothetical protein